MARPCGCSGQCGCTIIGVDGIRSTGTGSLGDPVRIGIANPLTGNGCTAVMSCVSGSLAGGLLYNSSTGKISVKLSSDGGNNIVFGTDGGLYATGSGGGGGSFATVAGLVAQTTPILGGAYGAGMSMHPEGPMKTYTDAMALNLPLIHVPVRRLRDQTLVASHFRAMLAYNPNQPVDTTDSLDIAQVRSIVYLPGGTPTGNAFFPDYPNKSGYFGHAYHMAKSMPLLSDIFTACNRRSVLYLEVKDLGTSLGDTANPLLTYQALNELITRYGIQSSVIVTSEIPPTLSTPDLNAIVNGLTLLRNSGVAIGVHLTTAAQMAAVPPANVTSLGMTWAACTYQVADATPATVKAYKDAGINTLLFLGTRQWQWDLVQNTTKFGAGGLKGILCADPIYVAGASLGQKHRVFPGPTWFWGTPDYGRHSNWSDSLEGQKDLYRGYIRAGVADRIRLDGSTTGPLDGNPSNVQTTYFILQGEQCPAPFNTATSKFDSYDVECGFIWSQLTSDKTRFMSLFVCVPEDRQLTDFQLANQYTKGYQFLLNQNGLFAFQRWDGISGASPAYQYQLSWNSPWANNINPGTEYRVKIRVRPDRIVAGPASEAEGGANTRTFNAGTGGGVTHRGAYTYVGRNIITTSDATAVDWSLFKVTPV